MAAGNSEFEVFMELSNYRLYDSGVRVLRGHANINWDVGLYRL